MEITPAVNGLTKPTQMADKQDCKESGDITLSNIKCSLASSANSLIVTPGGAKSHISLT